MGHDIEALRPGVNTERVWREFKRSHAEPYRDYEQYRELAFVAYLQRGAGNPLNQVLYLALGVYDDAYAGCSGNGRTLTITREQFRHGLEAIDNKSFAGMTRPRNLADDVMALFGGATNGAVLLTGGYDVTPEREFLQRCVDFCDAHGLASLKVRFG